MDQIGLVMREMGNNFPVGKGGPPAEPAWPVFLVLEQTKLAFKSLCLVPIFECRRML